MFAPGKREPWGLKRWAQKGTATLRGNLVRMPAPRAAGTNNPGLKTVGQNQHSAAATRAPWQCLRIHADGEMRCRPPAFRTRIASCSVHPWSGEMPTTSMTRTDDEPVPLPYLPLVLSHGGLEPKLVCDAE